jgi:6-phosphogluconolactonase
MIFRLRYSGTFASFAVNGFNKFCMRKFFWVSGIVIIIFFTSCVKVSYRLYVGGYTEKEGDKGFSSFNFNANTGELKLISQVDAGPNPSYFCSMPKEKLFYVIDEVMEFNGTKGGVLTTIKETGTTLEKKSEMTLPYGGPCFISVSHDSSHLFIANYPEGSVEVVKLGKDLIPESVTGGILYCPGKPDSSHAHMILSAPQGGNVYVSDLGLNTVTGYGFDAETGKLLPINNGTTKVPEGSGPRHFTFNADGTKFYLINELGSTIMVFNVKQGGELEHLQTVSTLNPGYKGENACADIHFGKDGKFLYGSNRGENSIVVFRVGEDGLLTLAGSIPCGGSWPRNFTVDPTGKFLLVGNERSDNISVFRIDESTGIPSKLVYTAESKKPVCLKIYKVD